MCGGNEARMVLCLIGCISFFSVFFGYVGGFCGFSGEGIEVMRNDFCYFARCQTALPRLLTKHSLRWEILSGIPLSTLLRGPGGYTVLIAHSPQELNTRGAK